MSLHPQTPQSPSHFSPSTAEPPGTMNASKASSVGGALPTPAHSVNGSSLAEAPHDVAMTDNDSSQKRKRLVEDLGGRNLERPFASDDVAMTDDSQKRKRSIEDLGEREHKKVHVEDHRLGLEDLHLDVGEKYLLCRTRKAPAHLRGTDGYCPAALCLRGFGDRR